MDASRLLVAISKLSEPQPNDGVRQFESPFQKLDVPDLIHITHITHITPLQVYGTGEEGGKKVKAFPWTAQGSYTY